MGRDKFAAWRLSTQRGPGRSQGRSQGRWLVQKSCKLVRALWRYGVKYCGLVFWRFLHGKLASCFSYISMSSDGGHKTTSEICLEDRELFLPSTDYRSGRDRTIGAVCVCVCLCLTVYRDNEVTVDLDMHSASWFVLILSKWNQVKVMGQSSRSQQENVANVFGATSSEGFLVHFYTDNFRCPSITALNWRLV